MTTPSQPPAAENQHLLDLARVAEYAATSPSYMRFLVMGMLMSFGDESAVLIVGLQRALSAYMENNRNSAADAALIIGQALDRVAGKIASGQLHNQAPQTG